MEHARARERLDEWLDGELPADEAAALSRHLDACAECRGEAALKRRLGAALFAPEPPPDPRATEAFVRRVMSRVEEDAAPAWRRLAGRALAPALGLGLAGLLLALSVPGLGPGEPLEGWDDPEPAYATLAEAP